MLDDFELNKIYNIDCIEGMEKIPDNSIDLIVTSPPYNIGIDYGEYDDNKSFEEYKKFILKVLRELYRIIKEGGIVAVNVGNQRNSGIPHHYFFWLKEAGFNIYKEIFWYKGLYYIQGETIFVCGKGDKYNKYYKVNDGFFSNGQFSTVWHMRYKRGESKAKLGHNAFFVLQMPINFIKINTQEGDIVLDPFMGVGTTALACKQLKRNYIGFEIDKKYIDLSNRRLSQQILI
ncbi:MAG: site-specific DNA-methyltransferase [Bacteroidetes bacterium]|nr:site-specific DNA-methyltransferase [Bacteroidota bacterium]